jgi:hypothetical protein
VLREQNGEIGMIEVVVVSLVVVMVVVISTGLVFLEVDKRSQMKLLDSKDIEDITEKELLSLGMTATEEYYRRLGVRNEFKARRLS